METEFANGNANFKSTFSVTPEHQHKQLQEIRSILETMEYLFLHSIFSITSKLKGEDFHLFSVKFNFHKEYSAEKINLA